MAARAIKRRPLCNLQPIATSALQLGVARQLLHRAQAAGAAVVPSITGGGDGLDRLFLGHRGMLCQVGRVGVMINALRQAQGLAGQRFVVGIPQ